MLSPNIAFWTVNVKRLIYFSFLVVETELPPSFSLVFELEAMLDSHVFSSKTILAKASLVAETDVHTNKEHQTSVFVIFANIRKVDITMLIVCFLIKIIIYRLTRGANLQIGY